MNWKAVLVGSVRFDFNAGFWCLLNFRLWPEFLRSAIRRCFDITLLFFILVGIFRWDRNDCLDSIIYKQMFYNQYGLVFRVFQISCTYSWSFGIGGMNGGTSITKNEALTKKNLHLLKVHWMRKNFKNRLKHWRHIRITYVTSMD